jgi:selenocysteine lyase/cysteine desulfurase
MGDLSRRAFLSGTSAVAGSLALGGAAACRSGENGADRRGGEEDAAGGTAFDPGDWASIRDQFPLTPDVLHFAAFVLAAHPRPVADAIDRHRRGLDQDTHGYLEEHQGESELAAGAAAAEYLGADPGEIAFTDSTTVRRVRLYDRPAQASVDRIVGRLTAAVTPATRAVAVTWVHSSTGVKLPIAQLAAALADVNAGRGAAERVLLCVDGVHGLGAEDETVATLGCDFLIAGTHKWLFGPRGTGIVWGRRAAWDAIGPTIPPFAADHFGAWAAGSSPSRTDPGASNTPGGYHSFEHRWAVAEAFRFHLDIGKAAVARRTSEQASQLKAGLADIGGVELVTPADPGLSAGIVCVSTGAVAPARVVGALADRHIAASVTPYRESYLRFGPSIVTAPDEVDAVVDAMRELS